MQVKTFTRWCNARLAVQQVTVEDLSTDLCDGVKLIVLLEVLSQKRLGKFNKKPRMHAQRMENVEIALQFITQKEKIRLVNIGNAPYVIQIPSPCLHVHFVRTQGAVTLLVETSN